MICGTNTGYHMYVHASDQCNELSAVFGSASTATTSAFTIKVSQPRCQVVPGGEQVVSRWWPGGEQVVCR